MGWRPPAQENLAVATRELEETGRTDAERVMRAEIH